MLKECWFLLAPMQWVAEVASESMTTVLYICTQAIAALHKAGLEACIHVDLASGSPVCPACSYAQCMHVQTACAAALSMTPSYTTRLKMLNKLHAATCISLAKCTSKQAGS